MMQNELFQYTKNDDGIHITKYIGKEKDIVVPDTIDDMSVVAIEEETFKECEEITSIVLPNTLTKIGTRAFERCLLIKNITIPNGVSEIGEEAFVSCYDLVTAIIPSSVTQMEDGVFFCCNDNIVVYTDAASRPSGWKKYEYSKEPSYVWNVKRVGSIGDFHYAVKNDDTITITSYCGKDETVVIPGPIEGLNVTSICKHAFYKCGSLTSVTIPESVVEIESQAFDECEGALIIRAEAVSKPKGWIDGWNSNYAVIWDCINNDKDADGYLNIIDNGIAYALKDGEAIVKNLVKYSQNIIIPHTITHNDIVYNVTNIGANAFEKYSINDIYIPSSVTAIGEYAFHECHFLERVTFEENSQLQSIGAFAFGSCGQLKDIVIPEGVKTLGNNVFGACTKLKRAILPSTLTSIGDEAFYSCRFLRELFIPSSVVSIGSECMKMDKIYAGATSKPKGWDGKWKNKEAIIVWNVKSLSNYGDFQYAVMNDNTAMITKYTGNGTDITIPDKIDGNSVTTIGMEAFAECDSMTSIYIPSNVKTIGKEAFKGCKELQSVEYEDDKACANISFDAFSNCDKLKNKDQMSANEKKITLDGNPSFDSRFATYSTLDSKDKHCRNMILDMHSEFSGRDKQYIDNLDYIIVYTKHGLRNIACDELKINMLAGYLLDTSIYGKNIAKEYEALVAGPLQKDIIESSRILGRQYVLDALEERGIDCTPYDYHSEEFINALDKMDGNMAVGYVEIMAYTEDVDIVSQYAKRLCVTAGIYDDLLNIFINYRSLNAAEEFIKKNIDRLNPVNIQYLNKKEHLTVNCRSLSSQVMPLVKEPADTDRRLKKLQLIIKYFKGKLSDTYGMFADAGDVDFVEELLSVGEQIPNDMRDKLMKGKMHFEDIAVKRTCFKNNTSVLKCYALIADSVGVKLNVTKRLYDVINLFDDKKLGIYTKYCNLVDFDKLEYLDVLLRLSNDPNVSKKYKIKKDKKDASFALMMQYHMLDGVDLSDFAEDLAKPENTEYAVALLAIATNNEDKLDLDTVNNTI